MGQSQIADAPATFCPHRNFRIDCCQLGILGKQEPGVLLQGQVCASSKKRNLFLSDDNV